MKKKLFLVVAMILVTILACSLLVTCKPKQPNEPVVPADPTVPGPEVEEIAANPTEFMTKWNESVGKFVNVNVNGTKYAISGNLIMIDSTEKTSYFDIIVVEDGLTANVYELAKSVVEKESDEEIEEKAEWVVNVGISKDELASKVNVTAKDFANANELFAKLTDVETFDFKEFDANFVKNEAGIYVGKEGTDFEGYSVEIKAKEMTIVQYEVVAEEDNDEEGEDKDNEDSEEILAEDVGNPPVEEKTPAEPKILKTIVYGMTDAISVPEDAKNIYDSIVAKEQAKEFIANWAEKSDKKVVTAEGVFEINADVLKIEKSDKIIIVEKVIVEENTTYDVYKKEGEGEWTCDNAQTIENVITAVGSEVDAEGADLNAIFDDLTKSAKEIDLKNATIEIAENVLTITIDEQKTIFSNSEKISIPEIKDAE